MVILRPKDPAGLKAGPATWRSPSYVKKTIEPWARLRDERVRSGLAISVNRWRSSRDFANRRFWLVERVWL